MAAASCQRCFLCLLFLSTPHFPAAAILESELGGGRRRRNKGSSSSRHFDFPSVTAWRGRPLTSAYTTQKREPAGCCQQQLGPPSLAGGGGVGEGRKEKGTALPRAPQGFGTDEAPGQPTDPQTSSQPPFPNPPSLAGRGRIELCVGHPYSGVRPQRHEGRVPFPPKK